jgi:hypothetical protein
MTHISSNNFMQNQPSGFPQTANSMFHPGFAGTNTSEVQHWNQGGHAQASVMPTYGMTSFSGLGGAPAQSMFQPGFANTNTQEVRQLNSGYAAPQQTSFQQQNAYQQLHQASYQQPQMGGYQQSQASYPSYGLHSQSIFSPGFASTNAQEVQARNHGSYAGYSGMSAYPMQSGYAAQGQGQHFNAGTGSIFSPGFAGTNTQEVRQYNQGGFYSQQPQQPQQMHSYANPLGAGAQSVFSPNFAGTNTQEVRSQNAGQAAPHTGSIFPGSF